MRLSTWMADRIRKRLGIMRLSGKIGTDFITETQRPGYYLLRVTMHLYDHSTAAMWTGRIRIQCCRKQLGEPGRFNRRRRWPDGRSQYFDHTTLAGVADWLEGRIAEALTAAYIADSYVEAGTPWPSPLEEATDDLRAAKMKLVWLTGKYQETVQYYGEDWDSGITCGRPSTIAWNVANYGTREQYIIGRAAGYQQAVDAQIQHIKNLTQHVRELESAA